MAGHDAVVDCRRRDGAASDTARSQQGELFVWRRFPPPDSCAAFNGRQHIIAAFDITGGAKADDARVRALWFK